MSRDTVNGLRRMGSPADLIAPFVGGVERKVSVGRVLQIYLPEVYPIPAAQEFNPVVSKATSAVETSVDTGLSVQVPPNNVAIIRGFTIFITNMVATTNVSYTLRVNGTPQPGFSNVSIFPRAAPYVGNGFDAMIRVPQGGLVTATYSNGDGGTYTIGVAVSGWWWPQELGNTWIAQGPQG